MQIFGVIGLRPAALTAVLKCLWGITVVDYISRPAFIADCEGRYCAPCKEQGKDDNGVRCRACWVDDMLGEVLDAPAADVEPVRHGEWIEDHDYLKCPECGVMVMRDFTFFDIGDWNYCPNCGAKMDLEDENGT